MFRDASDVIHKLIGLFENVLVNPLVNEPLLAVSRFGFAGVGVVNVSGTVGDGVDKNHRPN